MEDLNNKKVLIIRLSAIGDTVHTIPLANALRKKYPDIILDWVVEDKASKFIVNNPLINKVYVIPKNKWKKSENKLKDFFEFLDIIKKIRTEKYDIVIDTQQLLKSAAIMGLSGAKRKITLDGGRELSWIFSNEIIKTGRKLFDLYYHVVNRNLEFAKYLGCDDLTPSIVIPDLKCSDEIKYEIDNLDKSKKTIVISPATTWENKHWHINGWVDVINAFKDECNIVITASEKEKKYTSQILSEIIGGNITDLSGRTSIDDLIYIYKNCDILLTPDSGSCHIAWASGAKKIVSLFFATSASRTKPLGDNYYTISSELECSPCMKKNCPLKGDKNLCTDSIKSDKVIQILKKALQ